MHKRKLWHTYILPRNHKFSLNCGKMQRVTNGKKKKRKKKRSVATVKTDVIKISTSRRNRARCPIINARFCHWLYEYSRESVFEWSSRQRRGRDDNYSVNRLDHAGGRRFRRLRSSTWLYRATTGHSKNRMPLIIYRGCRGARKYTLLKIGGKSNSISRM